MKIFISKRNKRKTKNCSCSIRCEVMIMSPVPPEGNKIKGDKMLTNYWPKMTKQSLA